MYKDITVNLKMTKQFLLSMNHISRQEEHVFLLPLNLGWLFINRVQKKRHYETTHFSTLEMFIFRVLPFRNQTHWEVIWRKTYKIGLAAVLSQQLATAVSHVKERIGYCSPLTFSDDHSPSGRLDAMWINHSAESNQLTEWWENVKFLSFEVHCYAAVIHKRDIWCK